MKASSLILIIFTIGFHLDAKSQAQEESTFGLPNPSDLQMQSYELDKDAPAVVLYEKGKHYIISYGSKIRVIKEYYRKVKVFDAKRFNESEISIPIYKTGDKSERLLEVSAMTTNGLDRHRVSDDKIYFVNEGGNWRYAKFPYPKVEDGSILEYKYVVESPFFFDLGDWKFQDNLPKIYSEFTSEIPANYEYRKSMIGNQALHIEEYSILRDCFSIKGFSERADCNVSKYAMKNIPAFYAEDYMLSPKNYASSLNYELMRFVGFDGKINDFSKEWKDVDREFKKDKGLGKQLSYKKFFRNNLPSEILETENELERAKEVYKFVQQHFTWNESYSIFSKARVKEAFKLKRGSATEINLALINCLEAAKLKTNVVLLSTRQNGIVTKLYPILTEFNYAVASVKINEEIFLLDATDRFTPFGILPFRTLNGDGRIFDFDSESDWFPILPHRGNSSSLNAQLSMDSDGIISGQVTESFAGYGAYAKRKEIAAMKREGYIQGKINENNDIDISAIKIKNLEDIDEKLFEQYEVNLDAETLVDQTFIDPFFLKKIFSINPFSLETRNYPVDFGYPSGASYSAIIKIDPSFKVVSLPKSKKIKLQGNAAKCEVFYKYENNLLQMSFVLTINQFHYKSADYQALKSFFTELSEAQKNIKIVLEKF